VNGAAAPECSPTVRLRVFQRLGARLLGVTLNYGQNSRSATSKAVPLGRPLPCETHHLNSVNLPWCGRRTVRRPHRLVGRVCYTRGYFQVTSGTAPTLVRTESAGSVLFRVH
jgi:hypothetical protein